MSKSKDFQPKIRVFTTPVCVYCVTLKEFFKKRGVKFEEIDVSQNQKAQKEMIKKSKQYGVPVVEIDSKIVIGFDKEKITKLLSIKK